MIVQAFVGLSCREAARWPCPVICFVFYFSSECLLERNLQQLLCEHSARGHTGKNMLKSHLCTVTAADCCTLNLLNLLNLWISSLSVCIWNFNKDKVQRGRTELLKNVTVIVWNKDAKRADCLKTEVFCQEREMSACEENQDSGMGERE